jgi:putative hydrolase of the HAD superfamily
MHNRAIIFDLDDTLYDEIMYFRSGFQVVAQELESLGFGNASHTMQTLEYLHFAQNRQNIFQSLASILCFPQEMVPELVNIFRSHSPAIVLPDETVNVLVSLRKNYLLGCITDGWNDVQHRKLSSLGMQMLLDVIIVADELGKEYWKPHTLPFLKCCELLGVATTETIFVGDNPERDIRGAKNAGMISIRIRRYGGYFSNAPHAPEDSADFEINELNEIERLLEQIN